MRGFVPFPGGVACCLVRDGFVRLGFIHLAVLVSACFSIPSSVLCRTGFHSPQECGVLSGVDELLRFLFSRISHEHFCFGYSVALMVSLTRLFSML